MRVVGGDTVRLKSRMGSMSALLPVNIQDKMHEARSLCASEKDNSHREIIVSLEAGQ